MNVEPRAYGSSSHRSRRPMRSVLLSPHPDDETLFASWTLLREKPLVACVLSCGAHRAAEFATAMAVLGIEDIGVWGAFPEAAPDWTAIRERILALDADHLYVPDYHPNGNAHHNALAMAAAGAAPKVTHYLTYTPSGKQRDGVPVPYDPAWIGLKLRALACYRSQYAHPSHAPHFMRGLDEFYA